MGRPNIDVFFKELASTAVKRSTNGVAALIVKDDTDQSFTTVIYKIENDIELEKFTVANQNYIKDVLSSGVKKIIVSRVDVGEVDLINTAVNQIGNVVYNWIAIAEGVEADHLALSVKIKAMDSISAVLFNTAADHERLVNFSNEKVVRNEEEITGEKYISRILGLVCGCPLTESTTFKILEELTSVTEKVDTDASVDAGELVLFNDEGVVRVARGVNSLQTTTADKTEDMKKITIVETLILIKRDIKSTFKNLYVGKYKNNYDNQVMFISAINDYLNLLEKEELLEPGFNNHVEINIEAQRTALVTIKPDAAEWSDKKIKNTSFKSSVFPKAFIRVNDAIEDLSFNVFLV